jgi:hypothetical protein
MWRITYHALYPLNFLRKLKVTFKRNVLDFILLADGLVKELMCLLTLIIQCQSSRSYS